MNGAADLDLGPVTEPIVAGAGDRAVHDLPFDAPLDARAAAARALPGLAFHNLDVLARLGDPRIGELVALPAGDAGFTPRARFGGDGGCDRDGAWARLAEAWRRCTDRFGALDWDVAVYSSDHEWPRALACPGVVLVSARLDPAAPGTHWLYLLHELLHQWFGVLIRFAPGANAAWEAWVDAIAWTVAADVLGDHADAVYAAVYERQIRTGEPALAERGALVLAARRALGDEPDRLRRLADATAAARARLGRPRTVAGAPPLNAGKGTPHAG